MREDGAELRLVRRACSRLHLDQNRPHSLAPWLTDTELRASKRKALCMKWCDVGTLISLTTPEREDCELWHLKACDISDEEAEQRRVDRAKKKASERAKNYRQKLRDERKAMRQTTQRDAAVLEMLRYLQDGKDLEAGAKPAERPYGWDWLTVPELVKQVLAFDTFSGVSPRSVRILVHRSVKKLKALGEVKTKLRTTHRGPVLCVRLSVKNERNSVTPTKKPNPVAAQGLLPKNPTVTVAKKVEEVTTLETQNLTPSEPNHPALAASNVIALEARRKAAAIWRDVSDAPQKIAA